VRDGGRLTAKPTTSGQMMARPRRPCGPSFGLSAYDAYLGLAAFRGLALATTDEQPRAACLRAGVELAA
jgi:hypothetical protein